MKIIFLDIDGVIAVGYSKMQLTKWGNVYRFDKKAVDVLNSILVSTGAEIVLSSDWKTQHSLEEMREIFEWNGVIKQPIAFTINSQTYKDAEELPIMAGGRAYEISEYVSRHKLTKWVAIDDLKLHESDYADVFENHFVYCGRKNEGIKQCNIKNKILEILNNE